MFSLTADTDGKDLLKHPILRHKYECQVLLLHVLQHILFFLCVESTFPRDFYFPQETLEINSCFPLIHFILVFQAQSRTPPLKSCRKTSKSIYTMRAMLLKVIDYKISQYSTKFVHSVNIEAVICQDNLLIRKKKHVSLKLSSFLSSTHTHTFALTDSFTQYPFGVGSLLTDQLITKAKK